jgi:hypothetical protein
LAWYRADILNSINNTAIFNWPDDSGNHFDLTVNGSSRSPVYISNSVGGLPALRFDGSNDYLSCDDVATAMQTASGSSVFYVLKTLVQSSRRVFVALQGLGSNDDIFQVGFDGSQFMVKTTASGTTDIKTTGTQNHGVFSVYSTVFNNDLDNVSLQQDQLLKLNSSYTNPLTEINFANSTRFSVGQEWDSSNTSKPSDFLKADVAELFIYKKAVSASERLDLENYLKAKYGL